MITKKKTHLILLIFFSTIFFSKYLPNTDESSVFTEAPPYSTPIKVAGHWNVTQASIFIDDADVSRNWSKTEKDNDWCNGSGTWGDPYIIENVTFTGNGSGHCLEIKNSNAYFIINNCTFQNASGSGLLLNHTSNGILTNNTCHNNTGSGIYLKYSSNNNTISNNTCYENGYGIRLWGSNNNSIISNNLTDNQYYGIKLYGQTTTCEDNLISHNFAWSNGNYGIGFHDSHYNNITDNEVHGHLKGIYNVDSNNVRILRNNASKNSMGIEFWSGKDSLIMENIVHYCDEDGIKLDGASAILTAKKNIVFNNSLQNCTNGVHLGPHSFKNNITLNNAHDNSEYGILVDRTSNNTIHANNISFSGSNAGIFLLGQSAHCDNNSVTFNHLLNNTRGIMLAGWFSGFCDFNTILNNTINNTVWAGIEVDYAENNTVRGNNIANSEHAGIALTVSNNNTFVENRISNCSGHGIRLFSAGSWNNSFFKNILKSNVIHAGDNGTNNRWDNGSIGNFWDDYGGYDNDGNGIGDAPYNILGISGAKDNYPIWDKADDVDPKITILTPAVYRFYAVKSPNYSLVIDEFKLNKTWYTLDNGVTNITLTLLSGILSQTHWNTLANGTYTLRFHANDTMGNEGAAEVIIHKDNTTPNITIVKPTRTTFTSTPPFELTMDDINVNSTWYTFDGGTTNFTFTGLTGMINEISWNKAALGNMTIIFYARDKAGNLGFAKINITKSNAIVPPTNTTQNAPVLEIPGFDTNLVLLSVIGLSIIFFKKTRHLKIRQK